LPCSRAARGHGYEIGKLIESRSQGAISFQIASLYPMLYTAREARLDRRTLGGEDGERRRRFYRLTSEGRQVLRRQRSIWSEFVDALDRVAGIRHA
jgi:DNA-binding PadR family transcriptional regulator